MVLIPSCSIPFHPFLKNPNNEISFHSIPFHLKPLIQTEPWSWPSGWLGILEFAPPKVSGSFRSSANFGGLSPYRVCSGFK